MRTGIWGVGALLAIAFLGSADEDGGFALSFPQLLAVSVLPPLAAAYVEGWWRERCHHVDRRTRMMLLAMSRGLGKLEDDGEADDDEESSDDA